MQVRLFSFTYDVARGRFDDSEMQEFLRDKSVLSVTEQFFTVEQIPRVLLVVTYRDDSSASGAARREPAKDWRADLGPADAPIYDALRAWRARAAKREGLAAFYIFTNRQMADLARSRPTTIQALAALEGFPEARLRRWGHEILAVVSHAVAAAEAPPVAGTGAGTGTEGGNAG